MIFKMHFLSIFVDRNLYLLKYNEASKTLFRNNNVWRKCIIFFCIETLQHAETVNWIGWVNPLFKTSWPSLYLTILSKNKKPLCRVLLAFDVLKPDIFRTLNKEMEDYLKYMYANLGVMCITSIVCEVTYKGKHFHLSQSFHKNYYITLFLFCLFILSYFKLNLS